MKTYLDYWREYERYEDMPPEGKEAVDEAAELNREERYYREHPEADYED